MTTRKITRKVLPSALPHALPHVLSLAVVLITASLPHEAWADGKPAKSSASSSESGSSRIKELTYDKSTVYVVRTKYGYQTNIVFQDKEEVETMSIGDRSLWQIIPTGSRLFIRPMADNLATNMTLITNKRTYEFDLKSVDEKSDSNAYVIRFKYPDEVEPPAAAAMAPEYASAPAPLERTEERMYESAPVAEHTLKLPSSPSQAANPAPLADTNNYQYTYSGLDSLAPLQVYDDGRSTFIVYGSIPKSIPSALMIGSDGKESPAPSMVKGSSLVIDGIAGEIALRNNDGEVRIYNELINPR